MTKDQKERLDNFIKELEVISNKYKIYLSGISGEHDSEWNEDEFSMGFFEKLCVPSSEMDLFKHILKYNYKISPTRRYGQKPDLKIYELDFKIYLEFEGGGK